LDKDGIKAAIREELERKVAMSGGPEVFRRLVRGPAAVVETALQELVQEGMLTETRLRVGKIYHYPPNSATRLDTLAGFMKKMTEAPARSARPAHGAAAESTAERPPRRAAAGATEAPAAAAAPAAALVAGEKEPWVPRRATPRDPDKPRAVPRGPNAPEPPAAGAAPDARAAGEKEPWVPKRATPRDPNKPRAVPGASGASTEAAAPAASAVPGAAAAAPAAPAGPKEPWVPRRATPRDPNKPRAIPRDPNAAAPTAATPRAAAASTEPLAEMEPTAPVPPAPGQSATAPRPEEHGDV